jgi:Uma2 family endonuclease
MPFLPANGIVSVGAIVATILTRPITVAEFEQMPDPPGGYLELHHGEVVKMAYPKHGHTMDQYRLLRLLEPMAGDTGVVQVEVPYRPLQEYEDWRADVAYVSRERWYGTPRDGYLQGAPELVIEVLSPSNTVPELREKKNLCLRNGSREFWTVDSDQREVDVSTPDGRTVTYRSGQEIPIFFAPGRSLRVDDIFG